MGSSWQTVQSNHARSTNKTGNAMEVSEESLFKTLEGLNTGEHQIKQWMGLGQGKEILLHTKVTGLWKSFLQDFVETPNPNRLQNGADKFMEFTLNGYNEI